MTVSTAPQSTSTALAFVISNVAIALLAMGVVGLRFLARFRFSGLGCCDMLVFLGSLCALVLVSMQISAYCVGEEHAVKSRQAHAMEEQRSVAMRYIAKLLLHTFVFNIFYIIGLGATRVSVLLFLLGTVSSRPLKLACHVAITMTAVWTVAFGIAHVFVCTPIASQWDPGLDGKCASRIGIYNALIYTNIVLDLGIMLLPSYEIWHLDFSRTEKAGLAATFILGFGAVVANCARLTSEGVADVSGDFVGTVDDKFYFLAALEAVLGVAAVSIPALRPLYCQHGGQGSWLRLCWLIRGGCSEGNNEGAGGAELGRVRGRNTDGVEKGITVETEFILSSYRTSN
ncbi:uncharacterized protein PpBr36_09737 [Pyricularia pennisetigena]|uniref:uncharacterized protein n=1 Tax=Pyricularia pennisetigena TaxID=1578925 RepID=UPI001153C12E|nr:uncharacterized protein PpBr36_09737 [Pyricularia pennisetigena]TLS22291.1 hypothetical protein PpBr36_09737 [Pyricularia pennisetigena]